jgi:hypothetical protein
MLKGSMIVAGVAAVSATVAFLATPETSKPGAAIPESDRADNSYWDAYSVSEYYGAEYDWPRLKLAEPATRQSITHYIVPQIESLTPDNLARLAKQQDFCSGPFAIKCFGIPTSKLRGYVEWALGRHVHNMAVQSAKAVERSAASEH